MFNVHVPSTTRFIGKTGTLLAHSTSLHLTLCPANPLLNNGECYACSIVDLRIYMTCTCLAVAAPPTPPPPPPPTPPAEIFHG